MRVIALLAAYNERRFIEPCLGFLEEQGIEAYLIDNESTDDTVVLAERWLGRNLIGIETLARKGGAFDLVTQLRRKEQIAAELEADWFMHVDADEFRPAPPGHETLADAFAAIDRHGYNAVNFLEFTFVPTQEEPDHDHLNFQQTMRAYYPFSLAHPHGLRAWKAAAAPQPDLVSSGGHQVAFPGLAMCPESWPMKHYLFLSVPHAIEKYVERRFDPDEVKSGWHGWRARLTAADLKLPSQSKLRLARAGEDLDPSCPRKRHCIDLKAPPSPTAARSPVCVLGMSRSGTSLTTRVLNVLGVELGREEEMMKPHAGSNPTGFWEHQAIADLNEEILASFTRTPQAHRWPPWLPEGWQRDPRLIPHRRAARLILQRNFAGLPRWGWKDPRSCLTLPFWQELIPEMSYVICVRDPRDVAASLQAKEGIPRDEGVRLWTHYMSQAVLHTGGKPRIFVSYESFFPDPKPQVTRLARFLGAPDVSEAQLASVAEHLDERLWHQRGARHAEAGVAALDSHAAMLFARLSAACADLEPSGQPMLDAAARASRVFDARRSRSPAGAE